MTRFVAVEAKAMNLPLNSAEEVQTAVVVTVALPQEEMDDWILAPSAGVVPSGVEINVVTGVQVLSVLAMVVIQVLRSKISDGPGGGVDSVPLMRFVAVEVNEINNPSTEIEGFELAALPNVAPSGVETRYVVGTQVPGLVVTIVAILQVSRMYTCGVMPSAVIFETRLVASETNATYSPSELMTGL